MMRPMKLAGNQLVFGKNSLEYLKTLHTKRTVIVLGGSSMIKSGMLAKVQEYLEEVGAKTMVVEGVEPDPSFATVMRGAREMIDFVPDLIVALGGGSVMDAAKTMWIYYEHPELTTLEEVLLANPFPTLRKKALFCCIPSTAGTASEVSRSVVISDNETGMKHGLGNMEMMPDIAICDPEVTLSMPPHITAETGMDALTHAIEALVSTRANYLATTLAERAALDIMEYLPQAYEDGSNLKVREIMLNASMVAGLAFTNVSLGIVHSMAHALGGFFHVPHGLGDAILLPYVIAFNSADSNANKIYRELAWKAGEEDLLQVVYRLNQKIKIPAALCEIIKEEDIYMELVDKMAHAAKADGCTKTNPIIPTIDQLKTLFIKAYKGE
ncbi:MAG: iron-containing alcohol dehydrogenase [Lachnospiraceae bacterium]